MPATGTASRAALSAFKRQLNNLVTTFYNKRSNENNFKCVVVLISFVGRLFLVTVWECMEFDRCNKGILATTF